MANVNINLSYTLVATEISTNQNVFNRVVSNFQLPVTTWTSSEWFPALVGGSAIPFPTTPVFFAYVRNLGANNITLNFTPTGGSASSVILTAASGPNLGGVFLYGLSGEGAGGGIASMSVVGSGATVPCEFLVGV